MRQIFEVHIKDNRIVFMRYDKPLYCAEKETVVWVSGKKFPEIWDEHDHGGKDNWKNDRKLPSIMGIFDGGRVDPVPLATIACVHHTVTGKLQFTDGVTRTLWLLIHGVHSFPVICPVSEAEELSRLAGIDLA